MSHYCVKGCPKGIHGHGFSTEASLAQHRRTCEPWKAYIAKPRPPVSAAASSSRLPPVKKKAKLQLPMRNPQSTMTSSTSRPDPFVDSSEAMDTNPETPSLGYPLHFNQSFFHDPLPNILDRSSPHPELSPQPPNLSPPVTLVEERNEAYPPTAVTSSGRASRLPRRFRDEPPQAPPLVVAENPTPAPSAIRRVILIVRDQLKTAANPFGLIRHYLDRPSYDPDSTVPLADLCNHSKQFNSGSIDLGDEEDPSSTHLPTSSETNPPPWPFRNMSIWHLMNWMSSGGRTKSETETTRLVNEVILQPDFDPNDLKGFNAHSENLRFERAENQEGESKLLDNFQSTSITIDVPSGDKDIPSQQFSVSGLYFRNLISVIRSTFTDPLSEKFHFFPFKLYQTVPGSDKMHRVYSELYNSDAFLEEHSKVQRMRGPPENPDCKLEKVVLGLMFWSDATHLTSFGNAKMWPVYMMFGNLSKYIRSLPNSGACHHVAYIPSLPASFQDFASKFYTKWGAKKSREDLSTHCRRELMQAVWRILLGDDFVHAYHYGIVIKCHDGIERRFYPRVFTYSADYPEKVLLATIRDKGLCPCPRCLVRKTQLDQMGLFRDMRTRLTKVRVFYLAAVKLARDFIYKSGYPINGTAVNNLLKETSSIPTLNAFIERLGSDFNISKMLAVDLLHEIELGIWKTLFTHLIRMLYASQNGAEKVAELDRRFQRIPAFGTTIRHFLGNASEMKKLAARDFEDLLQCAIPAFEHLFEHEHNERLMKLLFRLAQWHALAKLRLHTEPTLEWLEKTTTEVGRLMRDFRDKSASKFATFELPREQDARARRQAVAHSRQTSNNPVKQSTAPNIPPTKKPRTLNLFTYKWHAMGDYVSFIRWFGTTDNYSTQIGELAHRTVKMLYGLTNKRDATKQIAKHYLRAKKLQQAKAALTKAKKQIKLGKQKLSESAQTLGRHPHHVGMEMSTLLEDRKVSPDVHHFISTNKNHPIHLSEFLHSDTHEDPAKKDFQIKLQDHLLGRFLERDFDGDTHESFTDEQRNSILLYDQKIYATKTLRVNFTTYNVRRDQDVINPRTDHNVVMVHSPDTSPGTHPFWYARVLGIFHADVIWLNIESGGVHKMEHMEFLWVRWMGQEPGYRWGIKHARLPKVGFVSESDDYAFGFLDPSLVLRAAHLIPDFTSGRTSELLASTKITAARPVNETDDWASYYVNIFPDRDMFMRHLGGGVGHTDAQPTTNTEATEPNDGAEIDSPESGDKSESDSDSEDSDQSGSNKSNSESAGSGGSDDDLGPDDGEEDSNSDGYASM